MLGHTISKDISRFIDNSALSVSDVDWDRLLSKSGGNEMKQIKSILLYVDAELDPAVLDRVVHIASVAGAKLTLAAVVEPAQSQISLTRGSQALAKVEQLLIEDRQRELDEAASSIKNPNISIATRVFLGSADDSIIRAVMTGQYDVLTNNPRRRMGCGNAYWVVLIGDCCEVARAPWRLIE